MFGWSHQSRRESSGRWHQLDDLRQSLVALQSAASHLKTRIILPEGHFACALFSLVQDRSQYQLAREYWTMAMMCHLLLLALCRTRSQRSCRRGQFTNGRPKNNCRFSNPTVSMIPQRSNTCTTFGQTCYLSATMVKFFPENV